MLFDLDGTLVDSAPDMAHAVNLMRSSRGLDAVPLELVRAHVSSGARGMIGAAFGVKPEHPEFTAMRDEFLGLYGDNLCVHTRLFPGMIELLDSLEMRAIAWGVVTNKYERFARPIIDELGLGARAAVVVGGDTCARSKPFPDPLLFAAAAMGVAASGALYVGDDERDVQAARAAGMPVIVAGYGYLGDGRPPSAWGADSIVQSVAEIGTWIHARARSVAARTAS
ncbi:MAG: phosphoglycolate phosphatase [Usitatibacter sp.]